MTVIYRDTNTPFHTVPDPEPAQQQHQPPVDDETMLALRTPFVTRRPARTEPNARGTAALDSDDPHSERPDLRPRRSGDRG